MGAVEPPSLSYECPGFREFFNTYVEKEWSLSPLAQDRYCLGCPLPPQPLYPAQCVLHTCLMRDGDDRDAMHFSVGLSPSCDFPFLPRDQDYSGCCDKMYITGKSQGCCPHWALLIELAVTVSHLF